MRLIINADDFGYTRANTEGIIEGYQKGIIRSTTALTNMPYLEYGKKLAEDCPDLGIGVHMTLTLGKSLTGVKSFTDAEGNFLSRKEIFSKELNMDEVYEEWKAQIEKYIEVFGRKPSHLDSHHSVHDFNEKQLAVAQRLADEYGLQLRRHCEFKFVGGFYDQTATLDTFLQILEDHKEEDIEIMTHPGYCDLFLYRDSSYNLQRVKELDILTSEKVLEYIREKGIELTNFVK